MKDFLLNVWSSRIGRVVVVAVMGLTLFWALSPGSNPQDANPGKRPGKLPQVSASVEGISSEKLLEREVVTKRRTGFQQFIPAGEAPLPAKKDEVQEAVVVPAKKLVLSYEPEAARPVPEVRKQPEVELPPGLLLRCRLFNGIESNLPETPLIAHVIYDIRINGKVVVPRGSEIHGTVRADDQRGRVMTGSSWQIVTPSGSVIKATGIGLNRDYDEERDVYGAGDGFAGIRGAEIRQDQQASKRFLAASALSAVGKISQQRNRTIFGDEVVASLGNSALEGGGSVANEYARMKLKELEKKKPFIRVPGGTEFYLYTQRSISIAQPAQDPGLAEALHQREKLMEDLRSRLRSQSGDQR